MAVPGFFVMVVTFGVGVSSASSLVAQLKYSSEYGGRLGISGKRLGNNILPSGL